MKQLLILALSLGWITAFGQIQQGARLVSGSLNFSGSNAGSDPNTNQYSVIVSPGYSRFVKETKTLDVRLGYTFFRLKSEDENSSSAIDRHHVTAGIGQTHYRSLAERLYLTLGYGAGFGYGVDRQQSDNSDTERTNSLLAGARFDVGLAYFFGERWLVDTTLGSASYDLGITPDRWQHSYTLGAFINNFSVRVSYFLDRAYSE